MSNMGFNNQPLFPEKKSGAWRSNNSNKIPTREEVASKWKNDVEKGVGELPKALAVIILFKSLLS